MVEAVIFDMDGTLVDTERLGIKGWEVAAEELGVEIPLSLIKQFIGRTPPAVKAMVAEHLGDEALAVTAYDRHMDVRRELAETELATKPGALEAIAALGSAGYRIGLATSSRRATAEFNLNRFGVLGRFETITCGEEVVHGKPDPEMYLVAAQKFGLEPHACAVVEDSPNGVRAGHAAGMPVFMVPDVIEPTDELVAMCERVLPSLHELPDAVAALG